MRRIGAEQELFLVDQAWRPAPVALEVLDAVEDPHFTTELGRFNLEINLDPLSFTGDCLRRWSVDLNALLGKLRVAHSSGRRGVAEPASPLPCASPTSPWPTCPQPRYVALSDAMNQLRGDAYEFRLKGMDELIVKHDSVMLVRVAPVSRCTIRLGPRSSRWRIIWREPDRRTRARSGHERPALIWPPAVA